MGKQRGYSEVFDTDEQLNDPDRVKGSALIALGGAAVSTLTATIAEIAPNRVVRGAARVASLVSGAAALLAVTDAVLHFEPHSASREPSTTDVRQLVG